jgi:hypothetical protein
VTPPASRRRPYGVLGVFVVILGAGLVLDADRWILGYGLITAGVACLVAEWRQGRDG